MVRGLDRDSTKGVPSIGGSKFRKEPSRRKETSGRKRRGGSRKEPPRGGRRGQASSEETKTYSLQEKSVQ